MNTRIEYITEGSEEIIFRIYRRTDNMDNDGDDIHLKLPGQLDDEVLMLLPRYIMYVEAVEGTTFAYMADKVVELSVSLKKFEEDYHNSGFCRASKSIVVNLNEVVSFKSMIGNRIIATLSNEEQIIISRHYAKDIRSFLKEGGHHGEV